jgi:hypothetical protein
MLFRQLWLQWWQVRNRGENANAVTNNIRIVWLLLLGIRIRTVIAVYAIMTIFYDYLNLYASLNKLRFYLLQNL